MPEKYETPEAYSLLSVHHTEYILLSERGNVKNICVKMQEKPLARPLLGEMRDSLQQLDFFWAHRYN